MVPDFGSVSTIPSSSGQVRAVANVTADAPPKPTNLSANAGSDSAHPGLNSLSDQPLSPQVMNELMNLYASLHGEVP